MAWVPWLSATWVRAKPHRIGASRRSDRRKAPSWHVPLPVLSGPTLEAAFGRLPSFSGLAHELDVAAARRRRALVEAAEPEALVEGQRRRVARTRADAHPAPRGLRQRVRDERRSDAATEVRRRHEEPRDDHLVLAVLQPDDADQRVALPAQPDLLRSRLQPGERLAQRREVGVADQLGLDGVRGVLDR